jgi:long-chain fatty acid transport protein
MVRLVCRTILCALIIQFACADQFHNVNQIVGDRAIGLAGAYVAVSDDPSGMVYNPAGIAFASSASISANVNTLQFNQIDYDDVLNGEYSYQRQSYQVLPNFFGVVQPLSKWKVGFYNAIVDSTQEKQDQSFENFGDIDRFVINLNNLATTYNVGPAAAFQVSKQLSIGLALPLHYRSTELVSNQHIDFSAGADRVMEWQNVALKTNERGIRPKLGISYSPIRHFSFGFTLDHTIVFSAKQTEQQSVCITDGTNVGCSVQVDPRIETYSYIPKYPFQIVIGGAWFPSNSFLLSADVTFNTPVDQTTTAFANREMTLDAAIGTEWYWDPQWALRSGAFTSMANTPILNNTDLLQNEHIDRYGGSLSIARFNKGSSISVGVLAQYGTGKAQLFGDLAGQLQEVSSFDMVGFFTTSYRY